MALPELGQRAALVLSHPTERTGIFTVLQGSFMACVLRFWEKIKRI